MWQTFFENLSWLLALGWAVGWFLAGVLLAASNAIWHWMPGGLPVALAECDACDRRVPVDEIESMIVCSAEGGFCEQCRRDFRSLG